MGSRPQIGPNAGPKDASSDPVGAPARPGEGGIVAPFALLRSGWARNVEIQWDSAGSITKVSPDVTASTFRAVGGPVVAGMPNLHSHAFQRLLVGRTQDTIPGDDFWTWRARMYQTVASLTLDTLEAASAWLFAELVAAGYTSVVEFHYVHRPAESSPEEAANRVLRAAETAGIRITLAPVLYRWAGFERSPLQGHQKTFDLSQRAFAHLFQTLTTDLQDRPNAALACAPHSLRAVNKDDLNFLLELVDCTTPFHIHVSEQKAEVNAALKHLGATPLKWLMENFDLDNRWGLVHCTQADSTELQAIREHGACTILCPTTEHDLGDGRFPSEDHGGANWGIGSDSQVSVSPMEELRTVLYGMRAATRRRGVLDQNTRPAGALLWQQSAENKEAIVGHPVGAIESGYRADLVVLDDSAPLFAGLSPDQMLSALVLSGGPTDLREVLVGGLLTAASGRHLRRDKIASEWQTAVTQLMDSTHS